MTDHDAPPRGTEQRRRGLPIVLVIGLCSGFPVLALAYALYASPAASASWQRLLLALAAVGVAAAGAVIWRLRGAAAPLVAGSGPTPPEDTEQLGALMLAFSRSLATIEEQAAGINDLARRLDGAYSELESTNARLKEFSFKDEVTGLYNRRFFSIRLEEEVSRYRRFNHPVSVVLLDLDEFKQINDEFGHAAGDATLRDMGEILLKYSRGINVICRYGGDEFAVLLVETSKAGSRLYADRIRHVLSRHQFAHGRRVTASFGIASLPEDVPPSPEELIRAADEALYAAKRAGKNRVSVFQDMGARPVIASGAETE